MNQKKVWMTFFAGAGVTTLALVVLYSPQNNNEKIISVMTKREIFTLTELNKRIEWGKSSYGPIQDQAISDELTFQQIQKDILNPLQTQIISGKTLEVKNLFVKTGGNVFGLDITPQVTMDQLGDVKRYSWSKNNDLDKVSQQQLAEYKNIFSKVDDFRIDIKSYYVDMKNRSEVDSSPTKMRITGFMELRGIPAAGGRRHDSGEVELLVEHTEGKWKIEQIIFNKMISLVSTRAPGFLEVTASAFTDGGPGVHLRREAIRRGGYAASLSDVNRDGFLDLYIGSQQQSQMWMYNLKTSKFENKMLDTFAGEKMVKTAIFNDFDNDQDEDLFVTTFNPTQAPEGYSEDLVIYKNDNGILKKIGDPARGLNRLESYYPMPAAVADFNNDGLMDIYVGFPGKKDFTFTSLVGHEVVGGNASVQGLFTNKGGLLFNEAKLQMNIEMKEGPRHYLYPHSAIAVDWNKDHNVDIVVIDDQDNLSPFYMNKGNAIFEQVAEKIGVTDSGNAMSIAVGDYNNDGMLDFAMSSVNLNAATRYENAMVSLWHRLDEKNQTGLSGNGVRLFQQNKNGTFTEMTAPAGLTYAGEGAAGLEFLDYNNDGYADLYVTNGLWSGDDRTQEVSHLLVNSKIKGSKNDDAIKDRTGDTVSAFMSFLIDFRGDMFDQKYSGSKSLSLGGYQRNRLYRNNGDGTFTDMSYMEGVDSISDGYIVATGDLDRDGKTDLILRNGDPAQKNYLFPSVQIFKNNMQGGKAIDLALKNNQGADAIGVGVTVEYDGYKQYKQLISNNGASQSERVLHFGIGNRDSVAKLTIHWASGDKTYSGIKSGRHEFSEMSSILTQK